jgi:hypothetical protein
MNVTNLGLDQTEEDILSLAVCDEVLESAAAIETVAGFTLGDCTALSVCPAW